MPDGLDVATWIALAGLVTNSALLVFVWLQLRAAATATRLDHRRRRQQATIEWYAQTLQMRAEFAARLPGDRDAEAIAKRLAKIDGRPDPDVIGYLNVYEMLAVAVNMGVHDIEVIDRISGRRLIAIYRAYEPWIEQRRTIMDSAVYEEFEALAHRLEQRATARTIPPRRVRPRPA